MRDSFAWGPIVVGATGIYGPVVAANSNLAGVTLSTMGLYDAAKDIDNSGWHVDNTTNLLLNGAGVLGFGRGLDKAVGKPTISSNLGLDALELAGIPKGERKSPSPYKQLGTLNRIPHQDATVEGPIFGEFLGEGSEHATF